MRRRAFVAGAAALVACGPSDLRAQCRDDADGVHDARGRILAFAHDGGSIRIAHEEIPGYMRAMTMSFSPCPSVETRGLAVGDRIAFRFSRGEGGHFLILSLRRLEPTVAPAG